MKHSSKVNKLQRRINAYEDTLKDRRTTYPQGFNRPGSLKK